MKKYVIVFKGNEKNKTIECDYMVDKDNIIIFRKDDGIIYTIHPRLLDTVELQKN
ncbi:MAG: hypothetical protein QQN41_09050 [Nitrosopumilus sp.]